MPSSVPRLLLSFSPRYNHFARFEHKCCCAVWVLHSHDNSSKSFRIILSVPALQSYVLQIQLFLIQIRCRHQILQPGRLKVLKGFRCRERHWHQLARKLRRLIHGNRGHFINRLSSVRNLCRRYQINLFCCHISLIHIQIRLQKSLGPKLRLNRLKRINFWGLLVLLLIFYGVRLTRL